MSPELRDVLHALGISGAILLTVTAFIIFICYVTVNRGDAEMQKRGGGHH